MPNKRFAELNNGVVVRVIVAESLDWCVKTLGGNWVETKKYDKENHNFAGIGHKYDAVKKNFISPKPFESWLLDDKCRWQPPKEQPKDGKIYRWNEDAKDWVEFDIVNR